MMTQPEALAHLNDGRIVSKDIHSRNGELVLTVYGNFDHAYSLALLVDRVFLEGDCKNLPSIKRVMLLPDMVGMEFDVTHSFIPGE